MSKEFFTRYEAALARSDLAAIAACYTGSFLVAGPKGSGTFTNDDAFLEWLRGVDDFNRQTGMQSMQVRHVGDEQALSPNHSLFSVEWAARFERTGDRDITFRISYLLEDLGDGPRILAYVSEEDQDAAMKEHGLLPDA